jgi:hypothetical protein
MISISPASVDRSDAVSVEVEGFADCRLHVEYRLLDDEWHRANASLVIP